MFWPFWHISRDQIFSRKINNHKTVLPICANEIDDFFPSKRVNSIEITVHKYNKIWKTFVKLTLKTSFLVKTFIDGEKRELLSQRKFFFREISFLVTSLVKTLLSRNFCQKCMRVNFRTMYIQCLTSSHANFTKEKFI